MALMLEEANRIIQGAVAKSTQLNIRVSVSVCDAGGRPLAFQRMDGAHWASAYGSQGKATVFKSFANPVLFSASSTVPWDIGTNRVCHADGSAVDRDLCAADD